ncbi:EAL domain-containing protein [Caenorhabditis elegans]|uniref:EAL domain-containing protein n=1 Tax=Caenorhabditis elegans TaxID=6239 RepID=D3DEL9_CAEEL|nr:EAL domain-containing protein [Caenorhabditis elegans]CBJ25101.1 EAL domain-containing protein [Caenorhabditis elegans]|eukprot:NP_001255875.1 Uncharacterized protein CELE_Y105C5A.1272 [Caenorhabditis elegans]
MHLLVQPRSRNNYLNVLVINVMENDCIHASIVDLVDAKYFPGPIAEGFLLIEDNAGNLQSQLLSGFQRDKWVVQN